MKKSLLLMLALVFSAYSSAYEYVNDEYCIYKIDIANLTAKVVNFCKAATSITIPSSFVYQGDTYVVNSIGEDDFEYNYNRSESPFERGKYEKYSFNNYQEIRSRIVELNLPNTITYIGWYAFKGMSRLKRIVIPARVENTEDFCSERWPDWFSNNSRLESITFMGMLNYEKCKRIHDDRKCSKVCLIDAPDPIATLDSLKNELKKYNCPNLKTIEVVPLKESLQYKNKWNNLYNMYSKRLQDTVSIYEAKLSEHPYYIEEDFFDSISISKPTFKGDKPKEEYSKLSAWLKKDYNKQVKACRDIYKKLNNEMEQMCKEKQPELYADRYCSLHPDFSAQIDSMYYDHKCDYSRPEFVIAVLDSNVNGGNCIEGLWNIYGSLFKNKEAYLRVYDNAVDVKQELSKRMKKYNELSLFIFSHKISTKGLYDAAANKVYITQFQFLYKDVMKLGIHISTDLIGKDQKAQKEFEKNGHYFTDADEFFDAYVRSTYKETLKTKKDEYKKHKKEKVNTTYNADNAEQEKYISELASKDENKAYIAYLFKTQRLDKSFGAEIKQYFPWDEIQKLIQSYSVEQLQNMSKNHSEYFEKYEIEF